MNMNLKSLIYSAFALAFLFLSACGGKDDDDATKSKEELISVTWSIDEVNIISAGTTEAYDSYTSGASTFTVTDAKTFTVTGAANLPEFVGPLENMYSAGTFAFVSSSAATLTSGSTSHNISIVTLDETNLTFTYQGTLGKETEVVTVEVVASKK